MSNYGLQTTDGIPRRDTVGVDNCIPEHRFKLSRQTGPISSGVTMNSGILHKYLNRAPLLR